MGPEMNRLFQLNRRREVGGGKDRRGRGRKHTEREEIKEPKKQRARPVKARGKDEEVGKKCKMMLQDFGPCVFEDVGYTSRRITLQ